jgi:hypothetical protein
MRRRGPGVLLLYQLGLHYTHWELSFTKFKLAISVPVGLTQLTLADDKASH